MQGNEQGNSCLSVLKDCCSKYYDKKEISNVESLNARRRYTRTERIVRAVRCWAGRGSEPVKKYVNLLHDKDNIDVLRLWVTPGMFRSRL